MMELILQKRIKDLGKSVNVNILEHHDFDINDLSRYRNIFLEYQQKGFLLANAFDDTTWILRDHFGNTRSLRFDLELYAELNTALKCYALLLISTEYSINHTQQVVTSLKDSIFNSRGFNINSLEELEEYASQCGYSTRNNIAICSIKFLNFISHPNKDEFIEKCEPLVTYIKQNRTLPKYKYILIFSDVIKEFEQDCNEYERAKYFPILLWWKITTIIPLRPTEMLLLKKNCITKGENNTYWITVPRRKRKYKGYSDIDIEDTYQINQEVYDLVRTYQELLPSENYSQYLMSYDNSYYEFLNLKSGLYRKDRSVLLLTQFDILLKNFYKEIVEAKYGYKDVERINPGDTRHLAFCNMMLQGFNMLSIAKMGGHRRLSAQNNYWNHIEYFAQSWVYVLSENNRFERLNKSMSEGIFNIKDVLDKNRIYELADYETLRPVEFGFCTDSGFPENCTGDCRVCKHYYFYPKENYEQGIQWLSDFSDLLDHHISKKIKLLQHINQNMKFNLQTKHYSIPDQEELSSTANELNRLMEQKAMVDSFIPKDFEVISDESK